MIGYKEWMKLNEGLLGATFASSVSTPPSLGLRGALVPEAKGGKKHMDAGSIGKEDDAETGDGEVVDAASPKDEKKPAPPFIKKKDDCDDDGDEKKPSFKMMKKEAAIAAKAAAQEKLQETRKRHEKELDEVHKEFMKACDDLRTCGLHEDALMNPGEPGAIGSAPTGVILKLAGLADDDVTESVKKK